MSLQGKFCTTGRDLQSQLKNPTSTLGDPLTQMHVAPKEQQALQWSRALGANTRSSALQRYERFYEGIWVFILFFWLATEESGLYRASSLWPGEPKGRSC